MIWQTLVRQVIGHELADSLDDATAGDIHGGWIELKFGRNLANRFSFHSGHPKQIPIHFAGTFSNFRGRNAKEVLPMIVGELIHQRIFRYRGFIQSSPHTAAINDFTTGRKSP